MIFVTLLLLLPAAAVILYVALSIPGVQNMIRDRAERELTSLLGSEVKIEKVEIAPFNRLTLSGAVVSDPDGEEALHVDHLGVGVGLTDLLLHGNVVISYAELIGFHANIYRDSLGAPLNIDPIISRFRSDGSKPPSDFTLAVSTVVIRKGTIDYNVLSEPFADEGRFDRNHISVSDLRADVRIPAAGNRRVVVDLKRLAARERSGVALENLRASIELSDSASRITDLSIDLPASHIAFNDISASFSPLRLDKSVLGSQSVAISTLPGSTIGLSDFAPFVPQLADAPDRFSLDLDIRGSLSDLEIHRLEAVTDDGALSVMTHGRVSGLIPADSLASPADLRIDLSRLSVSFPGSRAVRLISLFREPSQKVRELLEAGGQFDLLADILLMPKPLSVDIDGTMMCDAGSIDLGATLSRQSPGAPLAVEGSVSTRHFDPSVLLGPSVPVSDLSLSAEADATIAGLDSHGSVSLEIPSLTWGGHTLADITASADMASRQIQASLSSASPMHDFDAEATISFAGAAPSLLLRIDADTVSASPFIRSQRWAGCRTSFVAKAQLEGRSADDVTGSLSVENFLLDNRTTGRRLPVDNLTVTASIEDSLRYYSVRSDMIDGEIRGLFRPSQIGKAARNIFASLYPALVPPGDIADIPDANLECSFEIKPDSALTRFFSLPVEVVTPVLVGGRLDSRTSMLSLNVDAPYLWQKGKLIEASSLMAFINGADRRSGVSLSSVIPTKHGPMTLSLNTDGTTDLAETEIAWNVARESDYHGNFRFKTSFSRDSAEEARPLITRIDVNPSLMIFNDTAWTVNPSRIEIAPRLISVDNFSAGREGQHIIINGKASADSTDVIRLQLLDIDLDYVFETLNISSNVMFGGNATGDFYASRLLTKEPVLYTDNLSVRGLSYNGCVMGDGLIRSAWHNEDQSITIDADIAQSDGRHSRIDGMIRPLSEELDFKFYADRARVGFLRPFMSAFADDVSGYASGFAHLYGTFKLIDLKGDILAEDLKMKLGFTNTVYSVARDSVHITPGRINFSNVELTDMYGATARLSGFVTHRCFHEPEFRFNITDARDFLCYDVTEQMTEDPWYGKIFGNGRVTVDGVPGMVSIAVNMTTAPKSTFTFVLSDAEKATEYNFITFHDRDRARKDSIAALDPTPAIVRDLKARRKTEEQGPPTEYIMDFDVDVTPEATLILVMDPVGGDRIRANGQGRIHMVYASTGDLKMTGDYTLQRGNYNFTLQDIIIKDFTIVEGSKIKFNGNPYAAQLDIKAAYSVNANLTDLDESFRQDKELNRTNVPVNALLLVSGDMRMPDVKFDLEFPTLTRDVDRKVRSIVSTDDMMNRQIIYLLALNRFYTPDYMNATRGNELVSVASSTISSQLSSMLGQLSDKWSIAPNFRSDRGDFSDVEVDVALSSHLLNNRLLLNGNFGYRDKSLNNNSFIGDFDIRYLLNRSGSISLKAYNRYNDQNYYLKSALTTQGVGVVFKRDFDNIFSFLRPLRKKLAKKKAEKEAREAAKEQEESQAPSDSLPSLSDTIQNSKLKIQN